MAEYIFVTHEGKLVLTSEDSQTGEEGYINAQSGDKIIIFGSSWMRIGLLEVLEDVVNLHWGDDLILPSPVLQKNAKHLFDFPEGKIFVKRTGD